MRRPVDAIVALAATAPFSFSHTLGPTTITFGKVALVAAAIGLVARRAPLSVFARGAPRTLGLSILAVTCATALTAAVAYDRGTVLRETLKALEYLLTFGVAALAWSLDPDRRRFLTALTITVCAVAVLALAQEI